MHSSKSKNRLVAVVVLLACLSSFAGERSSAQRRSFMKENPCPSTGKRSGSCPGFVVDHVHPLCAGGADHPSNMAWQELGESLKKDADERRLCRSLRRK